MTPGSTLAPRCGPSGTFRRDAVTDLPAFARLDIMRAAASRAEAPQVDRRFFVRLRTLRVFVVKAAGSAVKGYRWIA
jgi:hypothetical protein